MNDSTTRKLQNKTEPSLLHPREEDFLTPEQRLDLVADILATVAARMVSAKEQD